MIELGVGCMRFLCRPGAGLVEVVDSTGGRVRISRGDLLTTIAALRSMVVELAVATPLLRLSTIRHGDPVLHLVEAWKREPGQELRWDALCGGQGTRVLRRGEEQVCLDCLEWSNGRSWTR